MALVLSLREGEDFFVGDTPVVVGPRIDTQRFVVMLGGKAYTLQPTKWLEVLPNVHLRASLYRGRNSALRRVQINAPSTLVVKGSNYRKGANDEDHETQ